VKLQVIHIDIHIVKLNGNYFDFNFKFMFEFII